MTHILGKFGNRRLVRVAWGYEFQKQLIALVPNRWIRFSKP